MGTLVKLPRVVSMNIAGCDPLVIGRDDITSTKSWYKLSIKRDWKLQESDFVDKDMFYRYFLVSLGLLEYPMVIIVGREGGGKSLCLAWMAYQISRLFGKRCTLDWTPPHPELFGNYFNLKDDAFVKKIEGDLNTLINITALENREPTMSELRSLALYNTVIALDEGDSYADKASRTNLTKLIGKLIRRRRHFHTGIFMSFVDPDDADNRLVFKRRTHQISCTKDELHNGLCSFLIENKLTNAYKYVHLDPSEWTDLWNTHNLVQMSHDVDLHFGNKKNTKPKDTSDIETDKW
jgi:hypothetical protein